MNASRVVALVGLALVLSGCDGAPPPAPAPTPPCPNTTYLQGVQGVITCVIDGVLSYDKGFTLSFDGNIHITTRANLSALGIIRLIATGTITLDDDVTLIANAALNITAEQVFMPASTQITAASINIDASGSLHFNGSVLRGVVEPGTLSATKPSLMLSTPKDLILGSPKCRAWYVDSLIAVGKTVLVQCPLIQTAPTSTSCNNTHISKVDLCSMSLESWTDETMGAVRVADTLSSWYKHSTNNVSFDFAVVAQGGPLTYIGSHVNAASVLLCSGDAIRFSGGTGFDTTGRGCGPGRGIATGETRNMGCGAGGGSALGKGGLGAHYDSDELNCPCAQSTPFLYDNLSGFLPTFGASGGGCGLYSSRGCPDLGVGRITVPSAGGGLIWVAAKTIFVTDNAWLVSDGSAGDYLIDRGTKGVSGGGAGGQIIIFASLIETAKASSLQISAQGGAGFCNTTAVSGGGGGGFVGLQVNETGYRNPFSYTVNVSGGNLETPCTSILALKNPDPDHVHLLGEKGLSTSLSPCGRGKRGLFCEAYKPGTHSKKQDDNGPNVVV